MASEVSSPAAHRLPAAIGRYEILSLLGAGGMAQVYLALQRGAFSSEKLVVIKQLRPELVSDEVFLTMFMDEARIALQLHHPNVVHTYEVGTDGSAYFLAMEFLEGLTLTQIVRKAGVAGLPLSLHVWILTQVLAGLSYAHELRALDGEPMGIVHRDVSPSNVMITSSGEVKLLDFGIAKAAGALSFTQQGVIKGKLGYVAPEQCVGRASDSRADLFAVGVMLWEAIAGRRRVIAETSAAAFEARIRNHEPRIEDVAPNVPPRLAEICARALAHDPDERYATAAEFRADLEDFLDTNYSRVGASRLAAQMVQLFTDEFTALRLRIERYVQESRRPIPSETPGTMQLDAADLSTFRPPAPRRRALGPLVAAGIVAAAGLVWMVSRGQSPSAASAAPPVVVAALPVPPVVQVAELPVAAPSTVRVSVVAFPKSARLKLDGHPIDNPYSGQLPTDAHAHSIEARADGFGSVTHAVSFSGDVSLVLDLTRDGGAPKAARGGSSYRAPRSAEPAKTPVREDGASTPPPTNAARGADSPPVPGQDLRGLTRAPRPIDEKDLYQ
jgi:serine/threonine-protein kinase